MTQHEEANRVRMSKRPVSMETRRFAGKYLNHFSGEFVDEYLIRILSFDYQPKIHIGIF